jgi:hypothetical protein
MNQYNYLASKYTKTFEVFKEFKVKYKNHAFDLSHISLWDKYNVLIAYYYDDPEMFIDGVAKEDITSIAIAAIDIHVNDLNQMITVKNTAIQKLWNETHEAVQTLFDEYLFNTTNNHLITEAA